MLITLLKILLALMVIIIPNSKFLIPHFPTHYLNVVGLLVAQAHLIAHQLVLHGIL